MGHLVVMCSSEDENQSYLASALSSYETKKFLHLRREDVKDILENAFSSTSSYNVDQVVVQGAEVDDQKYCVVFVCCYIRNIHSF